MRITSNHYKKIAIGLSSLLLFCATTECAIACTFSWQHFGDDAVFKRIQADIGGKVTDEYCNKYNNKYEIFISTNTYMNSNESLGHAIVGIRKRGTNDYPKVNMTGYRSKKGNNAIGVSYDLATVAALDALVDVMSDLNSFVK